MECGGLTAPTTTTLLDDLFSSHNSEVNVGMEWLSVFVEDCLSSTGSCLPPPTNPTAGAPSPTPTHLRKPQNAPSSFHSFAVAGKARSKRKRIAAAKTKAPLTNCWSLTPAVESALRPFPGSDPPLLNQAYWLADSELIALTKKAKPEAEDEEGGEKEEKDVKGNTVISQPRRCTHCLSQRTPQWRAGPLGPKTLCNACGVRYKSGRLLPEYRPAKSPTFVSYLHSNSHKKVMEMRNGTGIGTGIGIGMGNESSIAADDA